MPDSRGVNHILLGHVNLRPRDREYGTQWEAGIEVPKGRSCGATSVHRGDEQTGEKQAWRGKRRKARVQRGRQSDSGFWGLPIS